MMNQRTHLLYNILYFAIINISLLSLLHYQHIISNMKELLYVLYTQSSSTIVMLSVYLLLYLPIYYQIHNLSYLGYTDSSIYIYNDRTYNLTYLGSVDSLIYILLNNYHLHKLTHLGYTDSFEYKCIHRYYIYYKTYGQCKQ